MLKICLLLCCSKITENAKKSLASLKRENPHLEPVLAIVQVRYVCARWLQEIPCSTVACLKLQKHMMQKITFIQVMRYEDVIPPDWKLRGESQSHKPFSRPETATANLKLWEKFAKEGNDFSPFSLC